MSNEEKMRQEFMLKFGMRTAVPSPEEAYTEGVKACAAIKDAEIEGLVRKAKCYSALELQAKAEIAARDLMIKELRDVLDSANTALYYGECSINERNPEIDSKNERIARMMERMQDRIREALAKPEHHNSRALEKMLLEARIEELQFADEGYDARTYARLCRLKTELAELNKE